ncbi:MAG: GNAT family N-acetyltransferase [Candidatus Delongbacteria bacterium]|nr:GNAT family N-acetyltransferase [Candidatus Delongbacteria bacterium]MBN2833881.1 GNAT family N-acetyltransferase [Candidatus Delongbacteria bacterium]
MSEYEVIDFDDSWYEKLVELWLETGLGNPARGDNLEIINKTLYNGGKLLLLVDLSANKLYGTAWLTTDYRRIYLHHFGIAKDMQGKGLGKILMKSCIDFGRSKNMQMKLEVAADNIYAIKLYKSYGFNTIGDYDLYLLRSYD